MVVRMKQSQTQRRTEWGKRVAESKRLQRSSFTVGSLLFLGLVFIVCGIYGAARAWHIVQVGNAAEVIGRDPHGLDVTVSDNLVRCAGIAVVGVVMIWIGIRKRRAQERNLSDKASS